MLKFSHTTNPCLSYTSYTLLQIELYSHMLGTGGLVFYTFLFPADESDQIQYG